MTVPKLTPRNCILAFLSAALQAFGMYNIHALSGVTEGGVLGAVLLIDHWLGLSPAVSSLLLNAVCYAVGWKTMGKSFLAYSAIAACGYAACYAVCELFPPLFPGIAAYPMLAAVTGALFIGVGAADSRPGRRRNQQRRRARHEPDTPDRDRHRMVLSCQRLCRAAPVAELYPRAAHRVFPRDRHSLRADHRLDPEAPQTEKLIFCGNTVHHL